METTAPTPRAAPLARDTIIEVVGYVGAAVGLTAAGIALGQTASETVQVISNLITAAVLFGAGWALGAHTDAVLRMKSVFWFLSVFSAAAFAGALFAGVLGISDQNAVVFVSGLLVSAYSFALWWMARRSLQVLALLVSVHVTIVGLIFPDLQVFFGPPSFTAVAIVTWLFGIGVVALGGTGLVTPRRTTMAVGAILGVSGPLLLFVNDRVVVGEVLSIVTALGLMVLGHWMGERGTEGLGIVGILLVSSIIVGNHVEDQTLAVVAVVIGLVMVGAAIVAARSTAGPSAEAVPPPPPAPPQQPIGPTA